MAKYTTIVPGSLEQLRKYISHNGPNLGATLSLEEEISGTADGVNYWIGTYERYAVLGENRVSLNIVLLEISEGVRVIATSSGGSQAMFLKINHWSEDNFLNDFVSIIETYVKKTGT